MVHSRNLVKWLIMVISLLSIQNITSAQETIRLLVRGDDMGKSYGRTLGAIKAHRDGILTSASLMPTAAFFNESVRLCKENPDLATGIHITLVGTRQRPVLSPEEIPSLVTPKGFFYETSEQLKNANPSTKEMEKEIRAQIGKVRASGLNFVYLDWHRGVPDAARDIIYRICQDEKLIYGQDFDGSIYGYPRIKLVQESWPNVDLPDGQKVYYAAPGLNQDKKASFFKALSAIEPGTWVTTVHPGLADPERTGVTELLCAAETREIIKAKNIQLISYRDLWEEEFGQAKKQDP